MKALGLYSVAGMVVVVLVTAGAWSFLSEVERGSMLTAALIAVPAQVGFFWLLMRAQNDPRSFMVWWGVGILGRVGVLAVAGLALSRLGTLEPRVLIISLAGFLFALLLLEPLFLNHREQTATVAQ